MTKIEAMVSRIRIKNKITRTLSFLILSILALIHIGASELSSKTPPQPEALLKKADACRTALYNSAKKMRYRHNWLNCINLYKNLSAQYPKSDQSPWALYRAGLMHTRLHKYSGMEDDLEESIKLFRQVASEYKDHRLADDAQYQIGQIYYTLKEDPAQAYVEFLKVDIKFPSGDMRPKAQAMLNKLTGILTKKDGQTGKTDDPQSQTELTLVKDIRHWSTSNYTRVVIDLERPVKYVSDLIKEDPDHHKPKRLYVDLKDTYVSTDFETSIPIKGGLLQRARAGRYTKDTVRVVLDINNIQGYKIFHLYDPFRIVMDVQGTEKREVKEPGTTKVTKRAPRRGIRKVKKPDETVSLARQLGLSVKRICIDPGHGGKDPGCFLKGGIEEKKIVLNLAKKIAKKIEERLQCEAMLTRDKDTFLSLEQRTALANVNRADLFVSLHVNSYRHPSIHGFETYFLNMATDERAVMVAARENATSEKNISDLQAILNDLMLNTKISESSKLAHEIQRGMVSRTSQKFKGIKSLGVKQAPFYVLIGAEMPAILIETGFITNPTDRGHLLNDRYLETLADGIVEGLEAYIKSIEEAYKGG
ncbi:MAG: N-acetylmuramoyl-L-alanine amidase [Pseudomonadota bacterium]